MFEMEIDGERFEGFIAASVTRSLETLSGQFRFSAVNEPTQPFPIKIGSTCKIVIDDNVVMNGFVEIIDVSYSADPNEHIIGISGRDKTADLVDSQIAGINIEFSQPNIQFSALVDRVLQTLGITDIKFIQDAPIKSFGQGEIESASSGQTAFDFLETYARKRQLILTTDGDGNIVARQTPEGSFATTLSSEPDAKNIILDATFSFDTTQRFNRYVVVSQDNISSFSNTAARPAKESANIKSLGALDDEIRSTRLYAFVPEQACDKTQATNRALWEGRYRKSRSIIYNVTLQGFIAPDDEKIWTPNFIVTVFDDYAQLKGQMLISGVNYEFSVDSGSKTTLTLYERDAFQLKEAEQTSSKDANAQNSAIDAWLKKNPPSF